MRRTALSALRAMDILEFLALFPGQAFTLSQIAKATHINPGSCHSVLKSLLERGYVARHGSGKTYRLGLTQIALGQAALISQPMAKRAVRAAEQLLAELDVPVLLSTTVGNEILSVASLENSAGLNAGMRVGEKLPFIAPIGVPFVAWAASSDVAEWIGRRTAPLATASEAELMEALRLTRERGFQVELRTSEDSSISALFSRLASGSGVANYKDEMLRLINTMDQLKPAPAHFSPDGEYDVLLIGAPIFDAEGQAILNLSLGGLSTNLRGDVLIAYADRLMRACMEVMQSDRPSALR